jgi:hypothetical protein
VIALGTSTVTTQTKVVGSVPKHCRVTGVRFYGQAAVTATVLTADVYARTRVGAAGSSVQAAALTVAFASAALAKAGSAATLSTTASALRLTENQLLEVVITADACSAGPGDLLVEVAYEPHYNQA